jgi:hypothetical protein
MQVKQFKKSWLCRSLVVTVPGKTFLEEHYVKYSGTGIGNEKIYVDGICACSPISWLWFTPRFEFLINEHKALLKIRISPWFTIQSLRLFIDNSLEYTEGGDPIGSDRFYIFMSSVVFLGIIVLFLLMIRIFFLLIIK